MAIGCWRPTRVINLAIHARRFPKSRYNTYGTTARARARISRVFVRKAPHQKPLLLSQLDPEAHEEQASPANATNRPEPMAVPSPTNRWPV
jgi:hypothetical protein